MAKLSKEEETLMEKLRAKMEAPEEAITKAINVSINLGDKAQVALARSMGFLPGGEEEEGESSKEEPDPDDAPKRRSYFKETKHA